jgi:iron complex transport system ATP-binding protein
MSEISLKNISFAYGTHQVLKEISCEFEAGKMSVILGKNGSGKSTLLKIMAGLLKMQQGEVFYDKTEISEMSIQKRAAVFGFLPQQHKAVFPFKVKDVVLTGRAGFVQFSPSVDDLSHAELALKRAGIEYLKDRLYTELSGGEQQMVMLARVLAQQPRVLLLDEPTSHLDFNNQARILTLLRSLADSGMTVVIVMHDPNMAFLYGDRQIYLKQGVIKDPEQSVVSFREFLEDIYEMPLRFVGTDDCPLVLPQNRRAAQ